MEIKGFSLLELLLALSLAALIAAAAIPAWQQLLDRSRATAEINRLIATIQYARSQAVHRRQTVTLCPADGQLGCGGDWARGIIVFADGNSDGRRDSNDPLLRVTPALRSGSSLSWRSFGSGAYLRFRSSGMTLYQNGTFIYCPPDKNPHYARAVIINRAGRPRQGRDTNGNRIAERSGDRDIRC